MGDMLTEMASWLGKNPEVLIFIIGFVLGFFVGKR
jgi:hypothetical protein